MERSFFHVSVSVWGYCSYVCIPPVSSSSSSSSSVASVASVATHTDPPTPHLPLTLYHAHANAIHVHTAVSCRVVSCRVVSCRVMSCYTYVMPCHDVLRREGGQRLLIVPFVMLSCAITRCPTVTFAHFFPLGTASSVRSVTR